MKKILKILAILLALLLVVVAGYVIYVFATYERIPDNQLPEITDRTDTLLSVNEPHSVVTWNLGFGAYSADYTFFMDGGKESRARSAEAVRENTAGAVSRLVKLSPDLILLQEVDTDSTRSHHIDQTILVEEAFPAYDSTFASNYNSAYLFYPLTNPIGASKSGIQTLSATDITSSLRRSLPIETGFMKIVDLDRCYSVSVIPTDSGHSLCLYNLHLSAYTSDGTIATDQLKMMLAQMEADFTAGNYVIAGGDFNKDLLGNSGEVFGVSGENQTWAQPFPEELLPNGFALVDSTAETPVPSSRNTDIPYTPGESFVVVLDGFIVSDNVQVHTSEVLDEGFAYTDHNPVLMTFTLSE